MADDLDLTLPAWEQEGVARHYLSRDNAICWLLGYPFVAHELSLASANSTNRLLDLGCGPGDVSRWMADTYNIHVVGVDNSAAMLTLANAHGDDPRISYHLSVEDRMAFLPDSSVDSAMACFVFQSVAENDRVHTLISEVARVLRPGGLFTVLSPHPDHVDGATFEGFCRGEAGVDYQAGDPIPIRIRHCDDTWAHITNVYWPETSYDAWLREAGFTVLGSRAPLLADAHGVADPELLASRPWTLERSKAPFLLITSQR